MKKVISEDVLHRNGFAFEFIHYNRSIRTAKEVAEKTTVKVDPHALFKLNKVVGSVE